MVGWQANGVRDRQRPSKVWDGGGGGSGQTVEIVKWYYPSSMTMALFLAVATCKMPLSMNMIGYFGGMTGGDSVQRLCAIASVV